MLPLTLYILISFLLGTLSWALHLGPQSQVIVLLLGLVVFPLQRFIHKAPMRDLGFRLPSVRALAGGIILPVVILGLVGISDLLFGVAQLRPLSVVHNTFTASPIGNVLDLVFFLFLNGAILFLLEFVTEELMFRGYILGKLAIFGESKSLIITSGLFCLWHLPIAIWGTGLDPIRTPAYLINMALLGTVLGLLFLESRSLVPVAAFHAIWNSLEYNLFGFMDQQSLFVGSSRVLFDPEEGCIGMIILACVAASMLVRRSWMRSNKKNQVTEEMAATEP
jgi:membrane protease YdiL (CAAX protease family)